MQVHALNHLTQKDVPFLWDKNCEHAFEPLKEQLISSSVLGFPNQERDYILYNDASDVGVGAVLDQKNGSEEKVISYASIAFSGSVKNWTTTEKEAYAVVWAIHVYGRKVGKAEEYKTSEWQAGTLDFEAGRV